MKKILIILSALFLSLSANSQTVKDWFMARDYYRLGDSIATVMYQDTLTNTEFVRNYVASVLAAGVVPDSNFVEGSIDTLKTYIVYFDTINDGYANIKGGLVWDTIHQTLTIFNGSGSSTQIGQEQNIYVHNVSGSDIFAGDPIYIIPHNADEIRVGLASNLNAVTAYGCIGIATTDIPNGGTGRICSFGQVHDLNTDSWTEGAYLWLGDGVLQQTKPTSGHLVVIGQNLDKSATEGIIGVKVSFNSSRQYAVLTTDGLSGTYIDSTSVTVDSLIADSVFTNTVHTDTLKIGNKTEIYEDVNDIFQIGYNNFGANSHLTLGYEGANLSADGVLTLQSLDRIDLQGIALNLTGLGTDKGAGRMYTGTPDPTSIADTLNYDGNFRATYLQSDTTRTERLTLIDQAGGNPTAKIEYSEQVLLITNPFGSTYLTSDFFDVRGLGTTKSLGSFYRGSTKPTSIADTLNYDGNFYATKGIFDSLDVVNSIDAESAQISKLNIDTVNSVKIITDTLVLNGAAITDTIDLKSAVEAETFDTVTMGVLVADSLRITRYKARNYINGAGVSITISVSNTYYTIKTMSTGHSVNMTVTDSSITIPKDGWYGIFMHCSGHAANNGRSPHISLFVDDVEDTQFESETRHATSGENYPTVWGGERYCNTGEVLKIKIKYLANTGTYTIDHAGFDVSYNP